MEYIKKEIIPLPTGFKIEQNYFPYLKHEDVFGFSEGQPGSLLEFFSKVHKEREHCVYNCREMKATKVLREWGNKM